MHHSDQSIGCTTSSPLELFSPHSSVDIEAFTRKSILLNEMWSVSLLEDPLELGHEDPLTGHSLIGTRVALARCSLENLFQPNTQVWRAFTEGGRVARVALADYVARVLEHSYYQDHHEEKDAFENNWCLRLEPLSRTTLHQSHHFSRRRRHKRSSRSSNNDQNPFLLERTDVVACQPDGMLHVFLRFFVYTKTSLLLLLLKPRTAIRLLPRQSIWTMKRS